jgi:hypothetical protein
MGRHFQPRWRQRHLHPVHFRRDDQANLANGKTFLVTNKTDGGGEVGG